MDLEDTLRTWVQEHRVCWELSPLCEVDHKARVAVGYELRLFARHAAGVRADPGCSRCRDLYEKPAACPRCPESGLVRGPERLRGRSRSGGR